MAKVVTLGELLIRYSTHTGCRLGDSQELAFHYGGSEANVSVGLSGLSHDVSVLSAVPDNPLGQGAIRHLNKYGVKTNHIVHTGNRIGAYFVEVGAGPRATSVVYDRKCSSFSEISHNPWLEDHLFEDVDIFHVSGITPALSDELVEITLSLMELAKKKGVIVSFDSNYRAKLWSQEKAASVYKRLLSLVDYCSAGKLDAIHLLGIPEKTGFKTDQDELSYYYKKMQEIYPKISVFYATTRDVNSTNENTLTGTLWINDTLYTSRQFHIPYIIDRIGGGDSFASGVLHGLLTKDNPQHAIEFATGMSVLKHTYLGDAMSVRIDEVEHFIQSDSSKINR